MTPAASGTPTPVPTPISTLIGPDGGTVQSADGSIALTIPAGAWQTPLNVGITDNSVPGSIAGVSDPVFPVLSFSLSLTDQNGSPVTTTFAAPVQLSLQLTPPGTRKIIAPTASLYWFDPSQQVYSSVASGFDPTTFTLTASLDHFSDYLATVASAIAVSPTIDGFDTDLSHGTASVSIPLKVPPGLHGFQPALTLTYSSAGPNSLVSEDHSTWQNAQGSWVGMGWDLNLGYVEMSHFMAWNQRCYLVLNNRSYDLIYDTVKGDGTYYTQNNEFLWIKQVQYTDAQQILWNYFLVRTKDGIEYRFGHESVPPNTTVDYFNLNGSRLDGNWVDGSNNGNWLPIRYNLDQITDTFGNQITMVTTQVGLRRFAWTS